MRPENDACGVRRCAFAVLVVLGLLNAAAFAVRLHFVIESGPYATTTGFEEFNLYHLWKVAHGHPLFEWPQKEHYILTHYNGAFYHAYAWWVKLWRADGEDLVMCARLLTPLFAMAGVVLQAHLLRRLTPERGAGDEGWRWGLAFLTWFGPAFGGWWILSVRADVPAVVFSLGGFAVALQGLEGGRTRSWVLSSLLFFAAWGFKQYVVWLFVGTLLMALVLRVPSRHRIALVLPFGALVLAALAGSGEIYRYSILVSPGIYPFFPTQLTQMLVVAVGLNLFFWILGGWASFAAWGGDAGAGRLWRATTIALLPPLAMGLVQVAPPGSNINNMLESFVVVALLAGAAWLRWWNERNRRRLWLGTAILLTMIPLPVLHLALAAHDVPLVQIRGVSLGNLIKLSESQLEQRRRFAAWMRTLPKPLWIRDGMLQQPWFATADTYPAFLVDMDFENAAWDRLMLEGEGFAEWIKRRHFAAVIVSPHDWLRRIALRAGYEEVPVPAEFSRFPNEFGRDLEGPVLLLRSDGPPAPVAPVMSRRRRAEAAAGGAP